MKLLFLSDVSGRTPHVGDEAMLEANLSLFRGLLPGCGVTVAAGAGFDGGRLQVKTVPRLEFTGLSQEGREAHLERITHGPDASDPAVQAALTCDALIISGGGNLSKSWPEHIYERVAMTRLAASRRTPVLIVGQTLGPELNSRERALVSEILQLSAWTGLREGYSYALALELGAAPDTLSYQLDDAAFLAGEPVPGMLQRLTALEGRPFIAVTVHPLGEPSVYDPLVRGLACALRALANLTATNLIFLPHASFPGQQELVGDEAFGEAINRALYGNPPMGIAPVLTAPQNLWLTQQASLVISTRYHPLVFGLAGAVPSLGLWTDEYTRRKLQGALIHAHRSHDALAIDTVIQGGFLCKARELWRDRTAIMEGLRSRVLQWKEMEKDRAAALRSRLLAKVQIHTGPLDP